MGAAVSVLLALIAKVYLSGGLTLVYNGLWSIEILDFGLLNLC